MRHLHCVNHVLDGHEAVDVGAREKERHVRAFPKLADQFEDKKCPFPQETMPSEVSIMKRALLSSNLAADEPTGSSFRSMHWHEDSR